jgi:predicted O-methyltransferase YrrM
MRGWFAYKDITTQQHDDVADVFKTLFNNVQPKRILEIGTAYGGLTLLLRDLLDENNLSDCEIRSYDVIDKHYLHSHIENGIKIDVRIEDIFNHQYDTLTNDQISEFIQGEGTTLVLCDGGSKKNEFRILSKFLKKGDVIMAHDYSPNQEYFDTHIKDNVWGWLEIQDSDINESCTENNLVPYMAEEFTQVVWACRIKE